MRGLSSREKSRMELQNENYVTLYVSFAQVSHKMASVLGTPKKI